MIGHKEHKTEEKKDKIKEEKKKPTDHKQAKIEELTELIKRIQAEFENFKKREEKERKHFIEFSNAELIKSLLPVLDSIDSAKQPFLEKKAEQKTEEIKGIELIEKQLISVLEKYGLREIKALKEKFNPEYHDCLMQENNPEKEDGIILEELQKGFMLKDKILRHSKVKINSIEKTEKELNENKEEKKEEI